MTAFSTKRKEITCIIIATVAVVASLFGMDIPLGNGVDPAWIAIVLCGIPILVEAATGLVKEFDITADVLVALALLSSVYIGEIFAAGEVALIMQLGALLEDLTVAKAQAGIEKLVHMTPQMARKQLPGGQEQILAVEEVQVGDLLRVLPGETVPVDGCITKGETAIQQSILTGESLPVDKTVGDSVFSGTVNQYGVFEMQAKKVGEDSSVQRMVQLVKSADASKAKIVSLADRWAVWIVIVAVISAIGTFFVTGEVIRAVTILVVFCPCALVLATPTAIMAAIGNATKHGFLVREGDALERLAQVSQIAFDKTGTLTYGTPKVVAVASIDPEISDEKLFAMVAAGECHSEHPLGKAMVKSYQEHSQNAVPAPSAFRMIPGKGVQATIDGDEIVIGNAKLMEQEGIIIKDVNLQSGETAVYVGKNQEWIGTVTLRDVLREDAPDMIQQIQKQGVEPVLLTGDQRATALGIAKEAGVNHVLAECLPEDKLQYIQRAQQNEDAKICMVGDGINDAPALKLSQVGIAMGAIGSDITKDAADIVLTNDDIKEMPHLLALSKRMMTTIRRNLTFSMSLNVIAILLAITGVLHPVVGALVHNAGSVIVILNSAWLLRWERK